MGEINFIYPKGYLASSNLLTSSLASSKFTCELSNIDIISIGLFACHVNFVVFSLVNEIFISPLPDQETLQRVFFLFVDEILFQE